MLDIDKREAIRVRVKKLDDDGEPDMRKFSIDPRITSFEILYNLLLRAFDIKGEFSISYLAVDDEGEETRIGLLTDWDLEAAFLSASDPVLRLVVIPEPYHEESAEDIWDIVSSVEANTSQEPNNRRVPAAYKIPGIIMNQMEKTLSMVQRAFYKNEEESNSHSFSCKTPLTDAEFHKFLDPVGCIRLPNELRMRVFQGGIEHGLRKVVWKHILNVYPEGLCGRSRLEYMKRKVTEYEGLKETWESVLEKIKTTTEMRYIINMIKEDVLRTDRLHQFYSGNDDNENLIMLCNILTTYALNHPSVGYCQGMSDMASPILFIMKDEAVAYICFCALMERMKPNFFIDGDAIMIKFEHLIKGLVFYDPEFYTYLQSHQAQDILFCYRWLLLDLKREFAFDDALYMLEVLWSSLPPNYPDPELELYEIHFTENSSLCALAQSSGIRIVPAVFQSKPLVNLKSGRQSNLSFSTLPSSESTLDQSHPGEVTEDPNKDSVMPSCAEVITSGDFECFGTCYDYYLNPELQSDEISSLEIISSSEVDKVLERYSPYEIISTPEPTNPESETSSSSDMQALSNADQVNPRGVQCPMRSDNNSCVGDTAQSHSNVLKCEKTESGVNKLYMGKDDALKPSTSKLIRNLNEFLNLGPTSSQPVSPCGSSNSNNKQINKFGWVASKGILSKVACDKTNTSGNSSCASYSPSAVDSINFDASCELQNSGESESGFSIPETCHQNDNCPLPNCNELDNENASEIFVTSLSDPELCLEQFLANSAALNYKSTSDSTSNTFCAASSKSACPPCNENRSNVESSSAAGGIDAPSNKSDPSHPESGSREVLNSCKELTESTMIPESISYAKMTPITINLLPPSEFGGGNPFLMFLCLSILLLHRDHVMRNKLDCNDISMYFDKLVRKHDVKKVLAHARRLFSDYLQQNWMLCPGKRSSLHA